MWVVEQRQREDGTNFSVWWCGQKRYRTLRKAVEAGFVPDETSTNAKKRKVKELGGKNKGDQAPGVEVGQPEKARKAAAVERAGAARSEKTANGMNIGIDAATKAFEEEKARKAEALERARAALDKECAVLRQRVVGLEADNLELQNTAKRVDTGIDLATKAVEEEKARKATALARARTAQAAQQPQDFLSDWRRTESRTQPGFFYYMNSRTQETILEETYSSIMRRPAATAAPSAAAAAVGSEARPLPPPPPPPPRRR